MEVELKEVKKQPIVEAGDLVICRYGFQYLIGTDGDYFRLISIADNGCYVCEEKYTLGALMEDLNNLGLQRIVKSHNLKLIEL